MEIFLRGDKCDIKWAVEYVKDKMILKQFFEEILNTFLEDLS